MSNPSYSRQNFEHAGPTYWAIIIAILISIGLIVTQSDDARLRQSVQSQSDAVVSPLITLISRPIRSAEAFSSNLSDRQRAFEENKALRAELQALREERALLLVSKNKMERYEQIIGARTESDRPFKKQAARAISDIKGPFVRALLINAGQQQGLKTGQAVMSPEGMVGHIILAGSRSSRVLRLDDLNSRIPVMTPRSQAVAILAGDNRDKPRLLFIEVGMDWQEGDDVLTSGDDGQLPRGLRVGTVVKGKDGGLRVELSGMQNPLDWIWVAQFQPIAPPIEVEAEEVLQ